MKVVVMPVPVPVVVVSPFEMGEWVACEMEDYTTFAKVEHVYADLEKQRVKIFGTWGNDSVINAGDSGWAYANQCRRATEEEKEREERRRVFAAKGRRNNEFHIGDFVNNDSLALMVLGQDLETKIVTVAVNNSDETFEIAAEELELVFAAEDMCG